MNIQTLSARQCRDRIKAAEADLEDLRAERRTLRQSLRRNELDGRIDNRKLIIKTLEKRIAEIERRQVTPDPGNLPDNAAALS